MLLLQYKNEPLANSAYRSFLRYYMPEARETGITLTENDCWTASDLNQNLIAIDFDAPDKERALNILSDID